MTPVCLASAFATSAFSDSSGKIALTFSRFAWCFQVSIAQLDGYIQTITIHRGAAGVRGTQVVRLSPSPIGINQLLGCVPVDRALLREISGAPENFYVQVSTTSYPNGAMRGQMRQ